MRRRKTPSHFEPTILDGPRIRKPSRRAQEALDSQFNSAHEDYPLFYTANDILISVQQALSIPKWKTAMDREMSLIYENKT